MKIIDITWEKLSVEMQKPFKIAFSEFTHAQNIIVKITTDRGICGYGEAAPFAPVTGETTQSVVAALELFRPALLGMNPFEIESIHQVMDGAVWHNGSAKCAVDMAMYDLMGKASGQPVHKLLGGYQTEVISDITVSLFSPQEMADIAEDYVKREGYRILKIKAGIDPDRDIEAVTRIRKKVGTSVRLRVDANQGYDGAEALYAIDGFKSQGVEAVEQCLPDWDFEGAKTLYNRVSGIKLMMDESIHDAKDAYRYVSGGCADILNIKLMKCGGIHQALKINSIAEAGAVQCMVGCMFESKLAITAGFHLVAARKNISEADCDSFMFMKDPDAGMTGGFQRQGDVFTLSDQPGFGVDVPF